MAATPDARWSGRIEPSVCTSNCPFVLRHFKIVFNMFCHQVFCQSGCLPHPMRDGVFGFALDMIETIAAVAPDRQHGSFVWR